MMRLQIVVLPALSSPLEAEPTEEGDPVMDEKTEKTERVITA